MRKVICATFRQLGLPTNAILAIAPRFSDWDDACTYEECPAEFVDGSPMPALGCPRGGRLGYVPERLFGNAEEE
jgi:hypothetical protein